MGKLTELDVRDLGHGRHGDGSGLYLLVKPSGSRSWVLRIQVDGTRRDIGLGTAVWSECSLEEQELVAAIPLLNLKRLTLSEARKKAKVCRQRLRANIDPSTRGKGATKDIVGVNSKNDLIASGIPKIEINSDKQEKISNPYLNRYLELFRYGDGDDYEVLDYLARGDLNALADYIGRRRTIGYIIADAIRSMITGEGDPVTNSTRAKTGMRLKFVFGSKGRPSKATLAEMFDDELKIREIAALVDADHEVTNLASAIHKVAHDKGVSVAEVKKKATAARRKAARKRSSPPPNK